jgi:hypothetical protein
VTEGKKLTEVMKKANDIVEKLRKKAKLGNKSARFEFVELPGEKRARGTDRARLVPNGLNLPRP